MAQTHDEPEEYLPWRKVRPLAGDIGRTTAWRWIKEGKFPAPVPLPGGHRVAWRQSDLLQWQTGLANLEAA